MASNAYRCDADRLSKPLPVTPEEAKDRFIREDVDPKNAARHAAILLQRLCKDHPRPNAVHLEMAQTCYRTLARVTGGHLEYWMLAQVFERPAAMPYLEVLIKAGLCTEHMTGLTRTAHPMYTAGKSMNSEAFERLHEIGCRLDAPRMDLICEMALWSLDAEMLQALARCEYAFRRTGYVSPPDRLSDPAEIKRAAIYTQAMLYQLSVQRPVARPVLRGL